MRIAFLLFLAMTASATALPRYTGAVTIADSRDFAPSALDWLQGTVAGNATLALALLAAALLVFTLLARSSGWRLVAILVLSCFLLFASAAILSGMQSAMAR